MIILCNRLTADIDKRSSLYIMDRMFRFLIALY